MLASRLLVEQLVVPYALVEQVELEKMDAKQLASVALVGVMAVLVLLLQLPLAELIDQAFSPLVEVLVALKFLDVQPLVEQLA